MRRVRAQALVDRSASWRQRPASPRQLAALRRQGVEVREDLTSGEASALLDVAFASSALAPATPKQLWRLRQMGVAICPGLTRREASALIERSAHRRPA